MKFIDSIATINSPTIVRKTLLLVRVDAVGDYVLFRNFIELIRKSEQYKNYRIILCGNIIWKDLAENCDSDFIDEFIWVDRKKIIRDFYYRFKTIGYINKLGVEVAIQPTYTREFYCGDAIIKASAAKEKIGSIGDMSLLSKKQKNISDRYYTELIPATSEILFEFDRNKEFVSKLLQTSIEIKKTFIDTRKIEATYFAKKRDFVAICPSAASDIRRWKVDNYTEIADFIINKYNLDVVLIGSKDDTIIAQQICLNTNSKKIIDLTGKTTLTELAKILSLAKLVISNDTAAVHIAAAVNTYVLCVARGNQYGRFTRYPKTIFENFITLYPDEIMNRIDDEKFLFENYRYGSYLDINDVKVADVKNQISSIFIELDIHSF